MPSHIGFIPVRIGASTAPSVHQVQYNKKVTTKIYKFSDGSAGSSEGRPEYDWSLTCACDRDKQTILDLIEDAKATGELTITFDIGNRSHMLVGCLVSGESYSSDNDGTADLTLTGVAPDLIRVR